MRPDPVPLVPPGELDGDLEGEAPGDAIGDVIAVGLGAWPALVLPSVPVAPPLPLFDAQPPSYSAAHTITVIANV